MASSGSSASQMLRVAVVGGGPAGVIAGRFLSEAGHQPVVLERGVAFGGVWSPNPVNRVVYQGLTSNIPKVVMQSFDLDFPAHLPSYIRSHDMGAYFRTYAEKFSLHRFVKFGANVLRVRPLRSTAEEELGDSAWSVSWRIGDLEETEVFDAVVVANGHYEFPYTPEIPGQTRWLAASPTPGARVVLHSSKYEPGDYAGKNVLLVGGRASGVDIARDLRRHAGWVYVLDKSCKRLQAVGHCTHLPLGASIGADGHMLFGETSVDGPPIDMIILATGYAYTYPFLNMKEVGLVVGKDERCLSPLYLHAVHTLRPSLCFIGVPLAVPTPVQVMEAQSRFVASHLLSVRALGSNAREAREVREARQAWVTKRMELVGERHQDLHLLAGDTFEYVKQLVKESGVAATKYEEFCRRLTVVEHVYADRVARAQRRPWEDDDFRLVDYDVNWSDGSFTVSKL